MSEYINERRYHRLLQGCPIELLWDGVTESGEWHIKVRNVNWSPVAAIALALDGEVLPETEMTIPAHQTAELTLRPESMPSADRSVSIASVRMEDGVVWKNASLAIGMELPEPVLFSDNESYSAEFKACWQDTKPLYRSEFTESYWTCGCGQTNENGKFYCGLCGKERSWVSDHRDGQTCLQTKQRAQQEELERQQKSEQLKALKAQKKQRYLKIAGICGGALAGVLCIVLLICLWLVPAEHYAKAERYASVTSYYHCYQEYKKAGFYRDAKEKMREMQRLLCSETRFAAGLQHTVLVDDLGHVTGTGYEKNGELQTDKWNGISSVAVGEQHTVGLHFSGTAIAVGYEKNGELAVDKWKDIVQVGAGDGFSVGVKKDGTVVATGKNNKGQLNVKDWTDIVSVAVGKDFVLGLKSDGSVVAAGNNQNGQCDIQDWKNVTYLAAGERHSVAITEDGALLATGDNAKGACDISDWTDIVALSAGADFTVGLKSDGTLVGAGDNGNEQLSFGNVSDAVAAVCGKAYTIVLHENGMFSFFGLDKAGEGIVVAWSMR